MYVNTCTLYMYITLHVHTLYMYMYMYMYIYNVLCTGVWKHWANCRTFWPIFATLVLLPIYFVYSSVSFYRTFTRFIGQCPAWLAVSTPLHGASNYWSASNTTLSTCKYKHMIETWKHFRVLPSTPKNVFCTSTQLPHVCWYSKVLMK